MAKPFLVSVLVLAFLISAVAGTQFINFGKANPLPDIDPKITILTPQNATYHVNAITIDIYVESNWGTYSSFYNLDGQEMVPIENMTVISQKDVNIGKNPSVPRTVLSGNCTLTGLSEGWHNITFYLITDHKISLAKEYEKEDILYSVTDQFYIDTSRSFPVILAIFASSASMAVIAAGLLVYLKRHKRRIFN